MFPKIVRLSSGVICTPEPVVPQLDCNLIPFSHLGGLCLSDMILFWMSIYGVYAAFIVKWIGWCFVTSRTLQFE